MLDAPDERARRLVRISASGWRTVVRRNDSHPASEMSSNPTIESSSGTRTYR